MYAFPFFSSKLVLIVLTKIGTSFSHQIGTGMFYLDSKNIVCAFYCAVASASAHVTPNIRVSFKQSAFKNVSIKRPQDAPTRADMGLRRAPAGLRGGPKTTQDVFKNMASRWPQLLASSGGRLLPPPHSYRPRAGLCGMSGGQNGPLKRHLSAVRKHRLKDSY